MCERHTLPAPSPPLAPSLALAHSLALSLPPLSCTLPLVFSLSLSLSHPLARSVTCPFAGQAEAIFSGVGAFAGASSSTTAPTTWPRPAPPAGGGWSSPTRAPSAARWRRPASASTETRQTTAAKTRLQAWPRRRQAVMGLGTLVGLGHGRHAAPWG